MRRVIHTAQALVDEVLEVPSLPSRGGNVMASTATRLPGGAVTTLVTAARQGSSAVHAGAIGTGPNGDLIRAALNADGVRASAPPIDSHDTGRCVVLVEPSAERTFVTTLGAERLITRESLASSDPQPGDVVCVSGYSLIEPTVDALLPWLESLPAAAPDDPRGPIEIVLDPGAIFAELPEPIRSRVLAITTVWTGNADEAAALGGSGDLDTAPRQVAAHLDDAAAVVVRDGARGCAVHVGGRTRIVRGFPQTPVDTTGAGDTHTGALCAAMLTTDAPSRDLGDWTAAARYANAAAAISVTRRGPASPPGLAEVVQFLVDQVKAASAASAG
ncbi:MAG: PfkB family carbohydrate kinase [Actinomycetia bacterium]|nr:PfkB family carbohydrate kinase [Actinomycetes bacterium]